MDLVITRSKWYRGQGGGGSKLLRGDGTMCRLGFLAIACGLGEKEILEISSPGMLTCYSSIRIPEAMKFLIASPVATSRNSPTASELMVANDDSLCTSEEEREQSISVKLKENDINVTFVD